jgi:hypothetical protein
VGDQSDKAPHAVRLEEASRRAREAEANGDDAAAIAAWNDYRLIRNAGRPAEDLLAEGIALSKTAERLVEPR